jgi:hypothetical protein
VKILNTILSELFGLFVDDLSFTLALLIWIALVALLLPQLGLAGYWDAPLLFLGCILLLIENVRRSAKRARMPSGHSSM